MRRPRVECGLNFDSSGGGAGRHEELQEGGEENTNFLLLYAFTLFHLEVLVPGGTCILRYLEVYLSHHFDIVGTCTIRKMARERGAILGHFFSQSVSRLISWGQSGYCAHSYVSLSQVPGS